MSHRSQNKTKTIQKFDFATLNNRKAKKNDFSFQQFAIHGNSYLEQLRFELFLCRFGHKAKACKLGLTGLSDRADHKRKIQN